MIAAPPPLREGNELAFMVFPFFLGGGQTNEVLADFPFSIHPSTFLSGGLVVVSK